MKHLVTFEKHKYPGYPAGTRTVHTACCTPCLWYSESTDLRKLEELADKHIYERRMLGYIELPPHLKEKNSAR